MIYVAYYRVSTERQHASGLGLEAQRETVMRYVGSHSLLAEYVEIESGKAHANRPMLLTALAECRKHHATLLIARLDRLSRNVAFIANLMESSVDFVACDMPAANRLTLHILAAVAEHEREMISARTKAALGAAKARGVKLGNPRLYEAAKLARVSHLARRPSPEIIKLMQDWQHEGMTLRAIAARLNRMNIKTGRGCLWYSSSVGNQLRAAA